MVVFESLYISMSSIEVTGSDNTDQFGIGNAGFLGKEVNQSTGKDL